MVAVLDKVFTGYNTYHFVGLSNYIFRLIFLQATGWHWIRYLTSYTFYYTRVLHCAHNLHMRSSNIYIYFFLSCAYLYIYIYIFVLAFFSFHCRFCLHPLFLAHILLYLLHISFIRFCNLTFLLYSILCVELPPQTFISSHLHLLCLTISTLNFFLVWSRNY